jgi:GNAT superfamily N-acetyltransferase
MRPIEGLVVRDAEPEDEAEILELMRTTLGPGGAPRTAELWDWKHHQSPFGASPALLAVVRDQIVGLRAFLRWRWRLGERQLEAVRAVDTAVHPAFQRRGIFSHLTRRLVERVSTEGCELIFNTPNRRSGKGYRKLGWQRATRPPLLIRPLRPWRMAAATLGVACRHAPANLDRYPSVSQLLDWPGLGQLLDSTDLERRNHLSTPLDRSFLRWRYVDIPNLEYQAHWRASSGAAVALIFRSRLRRSRRELLLTEILARGSERDRRRLLGQLIDELATNSDVDYLLAGSQESASLESRGFHAIPWGPTLMTRCLADDEELQNRLRSGSWLLSAGDLEIF